MSQQLDSYKPLSETEQKSIPGPTDKWSEPRAKSIAVQNQEECEKFLRTAGHVRRWNVSDELYLAYSPQKVWEGTRIPRASLGVPLVMEQLESILPNIMSALFPLRDNLDIAPQPGTNPGEARAAFELLMAQFDGLEPAGIQRLREVARRCFKSAFQYGNGIAEVTWIYKVLDVLRYYGVDVPIRRDIPNPITGILQSIPTGEFKRIIQEKKIRQYLCKPDICFTDIRDFFIDPNTPSPNIQEARYCSKRSLVTIAELKSYRGQDYFDIPSDASLVDLARAKPGSWMDTQKASQEVYRQGFWMPQNDYSANPDTWRIELIRYYEKDRCIWELNRQWTAYNQGNSYEFLPFIDAYYIDVLGRFYGLSLADVLEGEQRTQQAILQARLDELALSIHAPILKRRGLSVSQTSLRVAPGRIIEVGDNPKEDFVKMEWPGVTAQAPMEVEASERRAQKITGITDLVALGAPSSGGNSANRTATGVNTQAAATGKRIQYIVENLETTFIEPLCDMVHRLNQKFLPMDQAVEILGKDGQWLQFDPLHVKNANVKFVMRASDKMRSRMMMMQVLPTLLPLYMSPQFGQMMAQQQGKTLDVEAVDRAVSDALQVAPMGFWRDMQPGEMQSMMMQQLAPQMMEQQLQSQRMDAMGQMEADKGDTAITKEIAGKMFAHPEIATGLLAANGLDQPMKMLEEKNKPKPIAPKKK
jgi:hypothetical protein